MEKILGKVVMWVGVLLVAFIFMYGLFTLVSARYEQLKNIPNQAELKIR